MLQFSSDGYIRLNYGLLNELNFQHLMTFSDDDYQQDLFMQGIPADSAGFSEWETKAPSPVSVGLSWYRDAQTKHILLAPEPIRSNVMLIDRKGYDVGQVETARILKTWLHSFDWRPPVFTSLPQPFLS